MLGGCNDLIHTFLTLKHPWPYFWCNKICEYVCCITSISCNILTAAETATVSTLGNFHLLCCKQQVLGLLFWSLPHFFSALYFYFLNYNTKDSLRKETLWAEGTVNRTNMAKGSHLHDSQF